MTSRGYIPLGDRVMVELDTETTTTPAGLHIPETAQRALRGTVLSVGPLVEQTPSHLTDGDRVVLTRFAGVAEEVSPGIIVVPEKSIIAREERTSKPGRSSRKR